MGEAQQEPKSQGEVPFREPSEAQYTAAATIIRDAATTSELQLHLVVGEQVVTLCGGIESWRAYNGREKEVMARLAAKLAELGSTRWSDSRLYRAGRLHEQQRNLGDLSARWARLEYSHFRAVQGLPWDDQRQLLDWARDDRWSADLLVQKVAGLRSKTGKAREPRPAALAVRLLRRIAGVVDDHDELAEELGHVGIAPEEIADIVTAMTALESKLQALQVKLGASKR